MRPFVRCAARRHARALPLALLALAAACGKDSTPPLVATSVSASASSLTFDALGATQSFTVSVRDQNGGAMPRASTTVSSSAPTVATVSGGANATVTAVGNGSASITIAAGSASTTVAVNVAQTPVAPVKVSGDAQSGAVGAALSTALRVKLQDRLGNAIANREVSFSAAVGNGSATPATVSTGSDGTASTTWTLGTVPGAMSINATSTGAPGAAAFSATAVVGAPATVTAAAGSNQTARVGSMLPVLAAARVVDKYNNPVPDISVTFATAANSGTVMGSPATTNAQGIATAGTWTIGTAPGAHSMTATVPGATTATFNATATTGPAFAMASSAGNNQIVGIGTAAPVAPAVRVLDLYSNPVSGTVVTFTVTAGGGAATATTVTSNAAGVAAVGSWTMGSAPGTNTITATAAGMNTVTFTATAVNAPTITAVSPSPLVPGTSMTITGAGFTASTSGNTVRVGAATATVTAATASQITATVPCVASASLPVTVTTGGLASAAVTASVSTSVRALAVGDVFVATSNANSLCNELPATGGTARYLVSVYNASTTLSSLVDFELGGNPASGATALTRQVAARRINRALMGAETEEQRRDRLHAEHWERERVLVEQLRAKTAANASRSPRLRTSSATASQTAPALGERRVLYWPWGGCSDTTVQITARVLYAGTRAIIWEDTSNAVLAAANPMLADRFQRLGQVFDADMYDVVKNTFSDPLLRDGVTDSDGRVHMVFTRRVNEIGGVAAYVSSIDQFPRSTCKSSNFGEFFYGSVPTQTGSNVESSSYPDGWYNFMGRTVIHEVKHVASMAARVANSAPYENSWLEEGTARHAEEVWARQALHRAAWRGNHGWGSAATNGMYCDFHAADATCLANDPLRRPSYGVRRQFNEIRPKLLEPWNWSPFGDASGQSGSVFYQTVWSLVRYAIDLYGTSDAAFLTALTNARTTGTTSLTALTGVPFEQLIGGWSLALYADDYPGLTSASNVMKFQTWNLRNIYSALNADPAWSGRFNTPFPITPTALTFGAFTAQQSGLRAGANAYYELSGTASNAQVLALRALGGGTPSTLLRIAIARLQ